MTHKSSRFLSPYETHLVKFPGNPGRRIPFPTIPCMVIGVVQLHFCSRLWEKGVKDFQRVGNP
jgi:hypothetical protein